MLIWNAEVVGIFEMDMKAEEDIIKFQVPKKPMRLVNIMAYYPARKIIYMDGIWTQ